MKELHFDDFSSGRSLVGPNYLSLLRLRMYTSVQKH